MRCNIIFETQWIVESTGFFISILLPLSGSDRVMRWSKQFMRYSKGISLDTRIYETKRIYKPIPSRESLVSLDSEASVKEV